MRLFVAITFSTELVDALVAAQASLRRHGADVKWVERENIHLTLKFLGEVSEHTLVRVSEALSRGARGIGTLQLRVEGTGVFPSWSNPRVIWAGMAPNLRLEALHRSLEEELATLGFSQEPFRPHITLGRVKSRNNWMLLKQDLLAWQNRVWGEEEVDRILLVQSRLTPEGPHYQVMETFPLT